MTWVYAAIVMLLVSLTVSAEAGVTAKKMDRTLKKQVSCSYLLYLPPDYGKVKDTKWPLLLFLHGAGERGDDVQRVRIHGPLKLAGEGKDFPFIIVAPQCPSDDWWDRKLDTLTGLIREIEERYAVDQTRAYCTGLSMGGFGTWALACEHPGLFAAVAPICGGGARFTACRMKDVPVWAFHGAKDPVVPLARSQEMVDALKECGAKEVKFTVYPEAGHDAWTQTYENPEFYNWLLQHHLDKAPEMDKL